ncbi:MAG: hypothetical protein ABSB19_17095 [Methylomonas sp.]|jgi:hypothetical protein
MSNILYNQEQSTFTNVAIVVGVVAQLCSQPLENKGIDVDKYRPLFNPAYYSISNSATYTRITNAMTGEYVSIPESFEKVIGHFYANLLSKQESLGSDFEAVLNDNLWELYES